MGLAAWYPSGTALKSCHKYTLSQVETCLILLGPKATDKQTKSEINHYFYSGIDEYRIKSEYEIQKLNA